jgi:hypothetical protein
MNIKTGFLILFIFSFSSAASSQETPKVKQQFVGIEAGAFFISADITNMDYIRGDMPSYPFDNSSHNLTSLMDKVYFGIKTECFSLNDKWGVQAGLRYSQTSSSVGKNSYWGNSTNYFYVLYRQDGINTEYLKVKELKQKSGYIGIPVEVRYFPSQPHLFRLYFKVGAEVGYLIHSKTDVVFYNDAMATYQDDIRALVDKPDGFSASGFGAVGFRIGRESNQLVNIEVCFPAFFTSSASPGLLSPTTGGGFQFNFQIPIKCKAQ